MNQSQALRHCAHLPSPSIARLAAWHLYDLVQLGSEPANNCPQYAPTPESIGVAIRSNRETAGRDFSTRDHAPPGLFRAAARGSRLLTGNPPSWAQVDGQVNAGSGLGRLPVWSVISKRPKNPKSALFIFDCHGADRIPDRGIGRRERVVAPWRSAGQPFDQARDDIGQRLKAHVSAHPHPLETCRARPSWQTFRAATVSNPAGPLCHPQGGRGRPETCARISGEVSK